MLERGMYWRSRGTGIRCRTRTTRTPLVCLPLIDVVTIICGILSVISHGGTRPIRLYNCFIEYYKHSEKTSPDVVPHSNASTHGAQGRTAAPQPDSGSVSRYRIGSLSCTCYNTRNNSEYSRNICTQCVIRYRERFIILSLRTELRG